MADGLAVSAVVWIITVGNIVTVRATLYMLGSGYLWRLRWRTIILPYVIVAVIATAAALVTLSK